MIGNGIGRDPATVELEVEELRDDCARLLHELERRYLRVTHLPGRIGERGVRLEREVVGFLRDHRVALIAGAALVGAGLLGLRIGGGPWARRRRRRRRLERLLQRIG